VAFGFGLLAVLTFAPLSRAGFTTSDDMRYAFELQQMRADFWGFMEWAGRDQGRITMKWVALTRVVPYLVESRLWYQAALMVPLAGSVLLFGLLSARAFRSRTLGALCGLFFLAFVQNSWHHNPLSSYPVSYSLGICCLLGAALVVHARHADWTLPSALLAWLLALLALLTTEAFVPYLLLFGLLVRSRGSPSGLLAQVSARALRCAPIVAALVPYLLVYGIYRSAHPSSYAGAWFEVDEVLASLRTWWQFSISSLPGYYAFFQEDRGSARRVDPLTLATVWQALRVEWTVKSLLVAAGTVAAFRGVRTPWPAGKLALAFGVGVALMFLPNVLVAFTAKYPELVVTRDVPAYLYTHHSFFGAVLVWAVAARGLAGALSGRPVRTVAAAAAGLLCAGVSLATDYHNHWIALDKQLAASRWRLMDAFLRSPTFGEIPEHSAIYAPTLYERYRYLAFTPGYWTRYAGYETGRTVRFLVEPEHPLPQGTPAVFYLRFLQSRTVDESHLLLARAEVPPADLPADWFARPVAHELKIFVRSPQGQVTVAARVADAGGAVAVSVDGAPPQAFDSHDFVVTRALAREPLPWLRIAADRPLDLVRTVVAYEGFRAAP